jgi:hypothetical protein
MPKKQKKTALRTPSRRKVSPDSKSGLIVTDKKAEHSAGTECVLDNRSHRTDPLLVTAVVDRGCWLCFCRLASAIFSVDVIGLTLA